MQLYERYPTRLEGSDEPFLADCYRAPPGSTVRRVLSLVGVTARITVKRIGGLTDGEVVIDDALATISTEVAHRFEYVPATSERRLLVAGSYQVYWSVTRNGRAQAKGPIDLSVDPSPYGADATSTGLVFSEPSNSGLLAVI